MLLKDLFFSFSFDVFFISHNLRQEEKKTMKNALTMHDAGIEKKIISTSFLWECFLVEYLDYFGSKTVLTMKEIFEREF